MNGFKAFPVLVDEENRLDAFKACKVFSIRILKKEIESSAGETKMRSQTMLKKGGRGFREGWAEQAFVRGLWPSA